MWILFCVRARSRSQKPRLSCLLLILDGAVSASTCPPPFWRPQRLPGEARVAPLSVEHSCGQCATIFEHMHRERGTFRRADASSPRREPVWGTGSHQAARWMLYAETACTTKQPARSLTGAGTHFTQVYGGSTQLGCGVTIAWPNSMLRYAPPAISMPESASCTNVPRPIAARQAAAPRAGQTGTHPRPGATTGKPETPRPAPARRRRDRTAPFSSLQAMERALRVADRSRHRKCGSERGAQRLAAQGARFSHAADGACLRGKPPGRLCIAAGSGRTHR